MKRFLLMTTMLVSVLPAGGAQARVVGPARFSPGPAPATLRSLVAASGGNAAGAAGARYSYLRKLDSQLQMLSATRLRGRNMVSAAAAQGVKVSAHGSLLVDVYINGSMHDALAALRALGMRVEATNDREPQRLVEGWLPATALTQAAGRGEVRALSSITGEGVNAGGTLTQGDAVQHGPAARAFGPQGAGVPVGVISNSINQAAGGIAASRASGDLPASVQVLRDGAAGDTDEGRAMAEIIYDEAPGIPSILFNTGGFGAAAKAAGIDSLVSHGAKVIADDTFYSREPFFQDGVVAQAVERASAHGAVYVVSAGNRARQSWEGAYTPAGAANDFDPGPAVDTEQAIVNVPMGKTFFLTLQWDEAFGHVSTNLAIDVYDVNHGNALIGTIDSDNVATGLPVESFNITPVVDRVIGIRIRRVAGARNPFMKYIAGGVAPFTVAEHATNSPTIDPDAASARSAVSVAAVNWAQPGANVPESFSSRGPARRLFDAAGSRLAVPDVRLKPDIAAADRVATSVPGFNPFGGTSAAAPSAAGIAALIRSAKPAMPAVEVAAIMRSTANTIDCISSAGLPDLDCGYGFLLADRAIRQAFDPTPPAVASLVSPATPNGKHGYYSGRVLVAWFTSDPGSPVVSGGCTPLAITTDRIAHITCTAISAGGTTSRKLTIKRDDSPPKRIRFVHIRAKTYRLGNLPRKSRIHCKATDRTSHVRRCVVKGFSRRLGKHRLTAKATNRAGLSSRRRLTYRVVR